MCEICILEVILCSCAKVTIENVTELTERHLLNTYDGVCLAGGCGRYGSSGHVCRERPVGEMSGHGIETGTFII